MGHFEKNVPVESDTGAELDRQKRMTRRICACRSACHAQASATVSPLANDSARLYRYCFMKIPPGGRCGSLIAAHITLHG
jgi:hypothetical protein